MFALSLKPNKNFVPAAKVNVQPGLLSCKGFEIQRTPTPGRRSELVCSKLCEIGAINSVCELTGQHLVSLLENGKIAKTTLFENVPR